ncbi:hypothetical protein [Rhizobium sp. RAF56]|uniref:hypothetical protein n=1 Tax=Rhizobium sp. RAF56 TaxID=3233062 RepID=UPI003F9B6482
MDGNSNGDLGLAVALANRMRTLIVDTRDDSFERVWAYTEREEWWRTRDLDAKPLERSQTGPQLSEMGGELNALLSEAGYEDSIDKDLVRRFRTGEPWSLGTEIEVFASRKIFRGSLIPLQEVPTRVRVSLSVFAFLTIHGDKDLLHRDNDQFGIHYHYVLANKVRTTTMICWDTRWASDDPTRPEGFASRPIFRELHGEGRYAKAARPYEWGDRKRKSIRDACVPDLLKWDIKAFRSASNNADAVWPINATLTPRLGQSASTENRG